MANKLVSFPIEVFGGLFGKAAKKLKSHNKKTKEAIDKAMRKKKK